MRSVEVVVALPAGRNPSPLPSGGCSVSGGGISGRLGNFRNLGHLRRECVAGYVWNRGWTGNISATQIN